MELRASELAMILDGIDMTKLKRVPRYERGARTNADNKVTSSCVVICSSKWCIYEVCPRCDVQLTR